jgi:hypothetical protein
MGRNPWLMSAHRRVARAATVGRQDHQGLLTEAPSAFGDLDQHPVGGDKVVWVKAGIHASGHGGDGLGQPGVEGGALGGELGGPGSVGGTVGDQALGFEAEQELAIGERSSPSCGWLVR